MVVRVGVRVGMKVRGTRVRVGMVIVTFSFLSSVQTILQKPGPLLLSMQISILRALNTL